MLFINRKFVLVKVVAPVLATFLSVVGLLAFAPAPASAASGDHFTCRASALRVEGFPTLSVLAAEPAIANSLTDPCASQHTAIANAPPALHTLLATDTGEASATTSSASNSAWATAQVANATVLATTLNLHADAATASAAHFCSNGTPTSASNSSVVNLSIGGGAPITTSGPVTIPAGGLADVTLNRTITTATSITQRAVDITILTGVYSGVHIVLGEARTGISGNPCVQHSGVPINTTPPTVSGNPKTGQTLTCSPGTWTPSPTSYTYQWSREGTPIVGATRSTYTVQTDDEGLTLTCTVTAYNASGAGSPATSQQLHVKLPHVRGCPRATGRLHGRTLGLARLGMTRTQAHRAFRKSSTRGRRYWDYFCLTPHGIRLAYMSQRLLRTLPASKRARVRGRGVMALTAYAYYAISGVRPGATLVAARRKLGKGHLYHIGLNYWYLVRHGDATAVLKVRHGIVEEIGIADARLTKSRKAQRRFMRNLY